MNKSMCPVCNQIINQKGADRLYNKCINLSYQCDKCGLLFTIAASNNAYEIAQKFIKLESSTNGISN